MQLVCDVVGKRVIHFIDYGVVFVPGRLFYHSIVGVSLSSVKFCDHCSHVVVTCVQLCRQGSIYVSTSDFEQHHYSVHCDSFDEFQLLSGKNICVQNEDGKDIFL